MSPLDTDALESLARKLCSDRLLESLARKLCSDRHGNPAKTSVWGPWHYEEGARSGCVNLWTLDGPGGTRDIPLATVSHPEVGRYLAGCSPDVVLALVARQRALESFVRCHVTHGNACAWWNDSDEETRCDCGAVDRALGDP